MTRGNQRTCVGVRQIKEAVGGVAGAGGRDGGVGRCEGAGGEESKGG